MHSTFTYICDVLRNPFRLTAAKVAASNTEDQPITLPPSSSPLSDQALHPTPSSSSSKSVLSNRTVAAHRDFMHQAARPSTTPKPSRCQSRKAASKAKVLAASSTLPTPLNPSDIPIVTASVDSCEDKGHHRGKRARFDVPPAPVIVDHHYDQLHAPHVYLDHVAHAEASAAYLRSLRPSASLFAPLVITPTIYYNVTTPSIQSSSPALANYLGARRPTGNTQEQELNRKRMKSLVQTLTETPTERHTLTRLSSQSRSASTPVLPQPASTPKISPLSLDEIIFPALVENLHSNPPCSSPPTETRTNIKDTNQYTGVAPATQEPCALEQPAKVLPRATEYPEPPCAANGNKEMIRIVGQDGSLHALVIGSLVSTYRLHVEESPTQEVLAAAATAATRLADSPDSSRIDVVSSSSSSSRSTVKSSELQSSVATSLSSTSNVSSRGLANRPSTPDAHLSAESDYAPRGSNTSIADIGIFSIATGGGDGTVVGADNRLALAGDFGEGHAPENLKLAPLSVTASGSTDLTSSEASVLLGIEGPSSERLSAIHDDGQSLVMAGVQLGLEEVDFTALAMLPASILPCASPPLRFAGLFKKRAKFVDASFTLRAHCRRENTWWLLVEGSAGSNLGNFTFGLGTEMSYAHDGLVDFTVLPFSSRHVLKRRYFATGQEAASQIAQLLRQPTGASSPFYSPTTSVITPDDPNAAATVQPYVEISTVSADGPPILLINPVAESLTPAQPEIVAPQELEDPHQADDGTQILVEDSDMSADIETTSVVSVQVMPTSNSEIVMHVEASLAIDESAEVIPDDLEMGHQGLSQATTTADSDAVFVNGEVVTEASIMIPQPEPASFEVDIFLDTVMDDHEAVTSTNGGIVLDESTGMLATVEDDIGLSDYEEDEEMGEGAVFDLASDTDGMDESESSAADPLLVLVSQLASAPAVTFGPAALPAAQTLFSDVSMGDIPTLNVPQALHIPISQPGSTIATYAEEPAQTNQASTVPPLTQPASTPGYGTAPDLAATSTSMPMISTFPKVEQGYRVAESSTSAPLMTSPPTTIGLPLSFSPAPSVAITTATSILNDESIATGLAANIAGDPVKSYARAGSSSSSDGTTAVPASSTVIARIASTSSTSTAATSSNATAGPPTPGQGFRSAAFTIMSIGNRSAEDEDEDEVVEQLRAPRHWEGEDDNPTMATWRMGAPRMAQPADAAESFISDVVTTIGINNMTSTLASRTIGRRRTAAEMNDDPTYDV
ncbi:hypothetical protein FRB98_002466 [Tulasnella sp. 332]|nr:hypothetical protein FRB98_002466 [Tulasnella sp. 332]